MMLETKLRDEEALELYERGVDWTQQSLGGFGCVISKKPLLYLYITQLNSDFVFRIFYESTRIYKNDGELARTLFEEVDKTFGGTLVDIEAQKCVEGIEYVRDILAKPIQNRSLPDGT